MPVLYVLAALIGAAVLVLILLVFKLNVDKTKAARASTGTALQKLSPMGAVKSLSILPLIDYYAADGSLRTEPGVSYLLRADDTTILMDMGWNMKKEHPSPLLYNMERLGVSLSDIDMIFISHPHVDHLGGMKEQKTRTFSLTQGPVSLSGIPVYAPVALSGSVWNPGCSVTVIDEPRILKKGIASIGPIPRALFVMGLTIEHSLAVNVADKGIVLVIGCGHQTVERIIDRARVLFDEPIYGIIGGLHFPVHGGRIMAGPVNVQAIVGTDAPPWIGITEADVEHAIAAIDAISPSVVGLSAHDSSDWAIERFRRAFGDRSVDIRVGRAIDI
ncbi:MAG: MBL fold metallo-hydrolase [Spirochaetales bacterium]|nr:MBL fold metallo-hydrolase [Spirochaetales bacterium]